MGVLSPSVVAAIDDLELSARRIVEGMRAGGNRSPFHGFSTEFRQHRPYRAGDDLKYLDWKLYGRSDRLYTRQFRETTNLAVMLVIDTSASMAFPQGAASKFRYATTIAAALAYLTSNQGNMVGMMTAQQGALAYLPARGGRLHLRNILARLDGLQTAGKFDAPAVISRAAQLLRRRGVLVVLSDFYDAEDETLRELRRVVQYGHDVVMLQLTSAAERELSFSGAQEFEDMESGAIHLTDAAASAPGYRRAVAEFLERCRRGALSAGVDYALLPVEVAPEQALRNYLLLRRGRGVAQK